MDSASRIPGLHAIAITDHDCIEGALEAARYAESSRSPLQVIVGEEVSSRDGHIVGLFLRELVNPDMSAHDTIEAIHEQKGLAVAVHPFRRPGREGVAALAASLPFDAVETMNGAPTPRARAANRRTSRLHVQGKAVTGGSDAHLRQMLAACATAHPGAGPLDFREAVAGCRTWPVRRRVNLLPYLAHAGAKVAGNPRALAELLPF